MFKKYISVPIEIIKSVDVTNLVNPRIDMDICLEFEKHSFWLEWSGDQYNPGWRLNLSYFEGFTREEVIEDYNFTMERIKKAGILDTTKKDCSVLLKLVLSLIDDEDEEEVSQRKIET